MPLHLHLRLPVPRLGNAPVAPSGNPSPKLSLFFNCTTMTLIDTLSIQCYPYTMSDDEDETTAPTPTLPPSLMARLLSDAPLKRAPSQENLLTPLSPASPRADADARFLSITPLAITALADLSLHPDARIRLSASSEILKHSPATRDNTLAPNLSSAAIAQILAPMATILASFASAAASTSTSTEPPIIARPEKENP